ncbi:MbtH family NRPS accessory protein [Catenulispora sp. NF23]|uniref:MbtH family NRPS accessory protein n=1 Tax=Catenulispora pinistramenti TaxID=2705254 RepID=A0ABS5KWZ0_9ACTN|nr:MbtH family NRPS accessory protein [Catenulispora pinistramenti]MBS2533960.1 MbtH family NRPS accessory protein [Catenulispora pinistramenti]MBS2550581.1 MbtH family NRPS accessory protein [Catenulispora pinistramenti]
MTKDTQLWTVVVNLEEQYSIWPDREEIPAGWRGAGVAGTEAECLDHIGRVWTDMRPLSLRRWMERRAATSATEKWGDGI